MKVFIESLSFISEGFLWLDMIIAKIDKTMQNRKFDKWFEQIILVFAYFFLFLLYNIGLSSLFWKSEMNNIR